LTQEINKIKKTLNEEPYNKQHYKKNIITTMVDLSNLQLEYINLDKD